MIQIRLRKEETASTEQFGSIFAFIFKKQEHKEIKEKEKYFFYNSFHSSFFINNQ